MVLKSANCTFITRVFSLRLVNISDLSRGTRLPFKIHQSRNDSRLSHEVKMILLEVEGRENG